MRAWVKAATATVGGSGVDDDRRVVSCSSIRDREKTSEPGDSDRARASGQLGNEGDEQRQAGPATMARRLPASQFEQTDSRNSAGRGGSGSG